jgi:hypothetical protein
MGPPLGGGLGGMGDDGRGGGPGRRPGGALERNENYKTTLCNHWLSNKGLCPFGDDCVFAHGEAELRKHPLAIAREQQQAHRMAGGGHRGGGGGGGGNGFGPLGGGGGGGGNGLGALGALGGSGVGMGMGMGAGGPPPGPPIPAAHEIRFADLGIPWQEQWRVRFFVIKSLNYKNLAQSVRRGAWRTHRNNERTLNEAFRTCDRVVLFFSVNESGHWQGAAVMTSPIRPFLGQQPPAGAGMNALLLLQQQQQQQQQDGWTAEFSLEWLRLVSLPFPHTRPLRNPLNDNLPISRSRCVPDCVRACVPACVRRVHGLVWHDMGMDMS